MPNAQEISGIKMLIKQHKLTRSRLEHEAPSDIIGIRQQNEAITQLEQVLRNLNAKASDD